MVSQEGCWKETHMVLAKASCLETKMFGLKNQSSYSQMMSQRCPITSSAYRFHYHSQKLIGSLLGGSSQLVSG